MRSPETTSWHSASWQTRPAQQQPVYEDPTALERVVAQISRLPPIVVSWEIEALRERLAAAQRGEAFLLQGGDCAETFADCESDTITKKLKILLQMSLVLLHGLKKPIVRVGRMAGQYAKPRSTDTETRDGVTLPSYRGDLVNRPEFTRRGARRRSGAAAARLRARRAHPELRARAGGGRLRRPAPSGVLGPGVRAPGAAEGCLPAHRALDRRCAGFLRGHQRAAGARGDAGGFLRQPRGPAPALRAGADALHPAPEPLVQPLDPHAVDRHAHRRRSTGRTSSTSAASPIRSASRSARPWTPPGCRAWWRRSIRRTSPDG